jgi:hypothetical protein
MEGVLLPLLLEPVLIGLLFSNLTFISDLRIRDQQIMDYEAQYRKNIIIAVCDYVIIRSEEGASHEQIKTEIAQIVRDRIKEKIKRSTIGLDQTKE